MKRPRIEEDEKIISTSSSSSSSSVPVQEALSIVFQYWMIPNMGWYIDMFEDRLPKLREEIIAAYIEYGVIKRYDAYDTGYDDNFELADDDKINLSPKKLMANLIRLPHYSMNWDIERKLEDVKKIRIADYRPQEVVPTEDVEEKLTPLLTEDQLRSHDFFEVHYQSLDFWKNVNKLFERFWCPISLAKQHQSISILLEVISEYIIFHRAKVAFFTKQQEIYSHRSTLIVYQLRAWMELKRLCRGMEDTIFSFVTYPLLFDGDRMKHHSQRWVVDHIIKTNPYRLLHLDPSIVPCIGHLSYRDMITDIRDYLRSSLETFLNDADSEISVLNTSKNFIKELQLMTFHVYQLTMAYSSPYLSLLLHRLQGGKYHEE